MNDDFDQDYDELMAEYEQSIKRSVDLNHEMLERELAFANNRQALSTYIQHIEEFENFDKDISFISTELDISLRLYIHSIGLYEQAKIILLKNLYNIYRFLHQKSELELRNMISYFNEYLLQLKEDDKETDGYAHKANYDTLEMSQIKDELAIMERVLRKKTI